MKYVKQKPVGIDIEIQRIQNRLYPKLIAKWGLSESTYDCFGRIYRNQDSDEKYNPEPYTGEQGIEYKDALYNDRVWCTSFFGVDSERKHIGGTLYENAAFIIFSMDLSKCKPLISHRADEEAHQDAMMALSGSLPRDTTANLITELDNVFREYNGWRSNEGIQGADLHPKHCFRINFDLQFTYTKC